MNRSGRSLRLDELLRELPLGSELAGEGAVLVGGVHQDSRRIMSGDLFVARKGAEADGAAFMADARQRGATAVLTDRDTRANGGLPCIRVADARVGLALAAAAVYGHPGYGLDIVGITGTNGKTTTAHLVRRAIDHVLRRQACALVGTVGHSYGTLDVSASHTTPEADDLARILAEMRDLGATHVAMEVSSIAMRARRVHAVRFRVAAFTNLTQDHLDYHGSMESYGAAKEELFTSQMPASAVIHVGSPFGRALSKKLSAPVIRISGEVGASPADAEIAPVSLALSARGIDARVRTPQGEIDLRSPLFGAHNVENLLLCLGIIGALDLDMARAAIGLEEELGAPGRLERCENAKDDAHTPDAITRVLESVRALCRGRVLSVFGCGGDRDQTKRRPMGEAAGRASDLAVVTNDNPRTEPPLEIVRPVVEGLKSLGLQEVTLADLATAARGYAVELDRVRAIESTVLAAKPGDTVVICGKGHEAYQIVGTNRMSFDDRVVARRALERRRAGRPAELAGHTG
jgi:UDP-N-acetylmuramoyl-L-alanyl-D-glutamate--2,6-diaminopimelate ligase